jgi:DDE superfamily endonuclease
MAQWQYLTQLFLHLKIAFPRDRSFNWFCILVIGFIMREDNYGVTSLARGLGLGKKGYECLLKHFERVPVNLRSLAQVWTDLVLREVKSELLRVNNRVVFVGDSTKCGKRGRRMPGVKRLRSGKQGESDYIVGHHVYTIGVIAGVKESLFCIPLIARVCEGLKRSPSDGKTVRKQMLESHEELSGSLSGYGLFDRFYHAAKFIKDLLNQGNQVVVRVRHNATTAIPIAKAEEGKPKRGRPRKYTAKTVGVIEYSKAMTPLSIECPWDGKTVKVRSFRGFWKKLGREVLWVVMQHPDYKKPMILLSTDINLQPADVLKLYSLRFKIEVAYKPFKHELLAFMYRFWTLDKPKSVNNPGDTFTHRCTSEERNGIDLKIAAYNYFLQIAVISQGLLQIIAIKSADQIFNNFPQYIRTIRDGVLPSEFLTRKLLKKTFEEFMACSKISFTGKKLIQLYQFIRGDIEKMAA